MPLSRHGYTPYELHFGCFTLHILDTLRSFWTDSTPHNIAVSDFKDIETTLRVLKSNLKDRVVQERHKSDHNKLRSFKPQDLVLMKIPGLGPTLSKLTTEFVPKIH